MKEFTCGEVIPGCGQEFEGESDEEILQALAEHARDTHGMDEIPPEVVDRIRALLAER